MGQGTSELVWRAKTLGATANRSGAAIIALVTPDGMMLFLPEESLTAEEAVERLTRQFPIDLVLVGGFK